MDINATIQPKQPTYTSTQQMTYVLSLRAEGTERECKNVRNRAIGDGSQLAERDKLFVGNYKIVDNYSGYVIARSEDGLGINAHDMLELLNEKDKEIERLKGKRLSLSNDGLFLEDQCAGLKTIHEKCYNRLTLSHEREVIKDEEIKRLEEQAEVDKSFISQYQLDVERLEQSLVDMSEHDETLKEEIKRLEGIVFELVYNKIADDMLMNSDCHPADVTRRTKAHCLRHYNIEVE